MLRFVLVAFLMIFVATAQVSAHAQKKIRQQLCC